MDFHTRIGSVELLKATADSSSHIFAASTALFPEFERITLLVSPSTTPSDESKPIQNYARIDEVQGAVGLGERCSPHLPLPLAPVQRNTLPQLNSLTSQSYQDVGFTYVFCPHSSPLVIAENIFPVSSGAVDKTTEMSLN